MIKTGDQSIRRFARIRDGCNGGAAGSRLSSCIRLIVRMMGKCIIGAGVHPFLVKYSRNLGNKNIEKSGAAVKIWQILG